MTLAAVGLGLVSPLGRTPSDHAFFARIGGVRPRGSPFRTASGDPFDIAYVPWIGARAPLAERFHELAGSAARDALAPLEGSPARRDLHALVCAPAHLDGPARALVSALAPAEAARFEGAAGTFAALADAMTRIRSGRAPAVLVLAADSLIDPDLLAGRASAPRSPWAQVPLRPGEAAAALLLVDPQRARSAGWEELGRVLGAAAARGDANDDNDEPADGAAMTAALRALPWSGPAGAAYGQWHTDDLRRDEWWCALARCAGRFDMEHANVSPEEHTGESGDAAGLVALVFGLASARHRPTPSPETTSARPVDSGSSTAASPGASGARPAGDGSRAPGAPFVAWALSRDGLRGAALAQGGSP